MRKKISTIKSFAKGVQTEVFPGDFWHSENIDIDGRNPYIIPSTRMFFEAMYTDAIACSTNFINSHYVLQENGVFLKKNTTWENVHENTEGEGLGIYGDDSNMYYASNDYAGIFNGTTWTDTWQEFEVSNYPYFCPIAKFQKFICFGNKNHLAVWDMGASSWTKSKLSPTIPSGYNIIWMKPMADYLAICAHNDNIGSVIFLWDGVSTTYNIIIKAEGEKCVGADVINNELFIVTSNGWINRLANYSSLTKLNKFPDFEEKEDILNLRADAVKFYNGILMMGVPGSGLLMNKRWKRGGIWAYNPLTNSIYFKHKVSNLGLTNITGKGISTFSSLIVDESTTSSNILGAVYNTGSMTYGWRIDRNLNTAGGLSRFEPYPNSAIIVTKIIDDDIFNRKRFTKAIINLMKPLEKEGNIILRYNISGEYIKKECNVISGNNNSFILSAADSSNVNVRDEVSIIGGAGGGEIKNIIKKEIDGTNYKFTVDGLDNPDAQYGSTTRIAISEFFKIEPELSGDNYEGIITKLIRFHARTKKIQFKIEIKSPEDKNFNVGISDLSIEYALDKILNK